MFSANENLILRKHKRRIVDRIEKTMPEEALDFGTTVMVMQVSCKDPGCVPLETAIIIVFPKYGDAELVPGLPESKDGGSYKTKILKPMANVTEEDILDNLPPAFEGGRRTMERVCMYARDVMIGQITQLFGDGSDDKDNNNDTTAVKDRMAMATYLQACLQDYMDGGCKPPPPGEPFVKTNVVDVDVDVDVDFDETISDTATKGETNEKSIEEKSKDILVEKKIQHLPQAMSSVKVATAVSNTNTNTKSSSIPSKGNIVIRRKLDDDTATATATATKIQPVRIPTTTATTNITTTTSIRARQPPKHERAIHRALNNSQGRGGSSSISSLFEREHAPGIRKPGCPCCDPDDPAVLADRMIMM